MSNFRLDDILGLLPEAAEAAVASLPIPPLAAGYASDGTEAHEYIPDGARAISCRMRGLKGELILLLSGAMARTVEEGPLGNQGMAIAVEPALSRATVVLDQAAPAAIRMQQATEIEPASWLARLPVAFAFSAIPLFADEAHEASLILLLDDPAEQEQPGPDATDDEEAGYETFVPKEAPMPASSLGAVSASPFPDVAGVATGGAALRLLHNVEMQVSVELGRTRMTVRSILGLTPGSVVELDRAAGSPVDLLVNGTLIARGEVVVIDEEYGVRISEIVGRAEEAAS